MKGLWQSLCVGKGVQLWSRGGGPDPRKGSARIRHRSDSSIAPSYFSRSCSSVGGRPLTKTVSSLPVVRSYTCEYTVNGFLNRFWLFIYFQRMILHYTHKNRVWCTLWAIITTNVGQCILDVSLHRSDYTKHMMR